MSKYYLFNVFDTLVTGKVGVPHHIHIQTGIEIQDKIESDIEPELFANSRIEAEKQFIKKNGYTPDIFAIYSEISEKLEISDEITGKILETELKIELDNSLPVKTNINFLNIVRNDGGRIIYLSDKCYDKDFIKKILVKLDIYREGEHIFITSDYGMNSQNRGFFSAIRKELGINEHELIHVGDDTDAGKTGDILPGISGLHLQELNLNRYEKYLIDISTRYELSSGSILKYSKLAGASRYARLQRTDENRCIYDVAASVAAPFLISFISHVLEKATGKTIYFIARDGYILHRIAEKLNEGNKYDVELKYLYLSREVMVLANLNDMDYEKYIQYLKTLFAHEKFSYLLDLFSIDKKSLKNLNLADADLNQAISSFGEKFIDDFFNEDIVKQSILRESRLRKKRIVAYLEREGLLDDQPVTIVDSGWYLTIHNLLAGFLKNAGKSPPEGFYFGINESANSSVRNGPKHGYLWNFRKNHSTLKVSGIGLLLEVFCSAPHGRTYDYELNEKTVQPLLDSHEIEYLSEWGVQDLINGILSTVDSTIKNKTPLSSNRIDPDIFAGLIKQFWLQPTRDEIDHWGKYPFMLRRDGYGVITLHRDKSFLKIFTHILTRGKLPNEFGNFDFWPNAHIYSLDNIRSSVLRYSLRLRRKLFFLKKIYLS